MLGGIERYVTYDLACYVRLGVQNMPGYGQSEPAPTNAPVGRSVHWMGCVFSFSTRWGSSQSFFFLLLSTVSFYFIFGS